VNGGGVWCGSACGRWWVRVGAEMGEETSTAQGRNKGGKGENVT
jgi:hypothetical protein